MSNHHERVEAAAEVLGAKERVETPETPLWLLLRRDAHDPGLFPWKREQILRRSDEERRLHEFGEAVHETTLRDEQRIEALVQATGKNEEELLDVYDYNLDKLLAACPPLEGGRGVLTS